MFWGQLHRSILFELTKVFLLAFVGLTGMLLLAGVIAEATRNGMRPTQILAVIPLLVPSTVPYTLPTTTLFATCVVYGRLAHDNEILALRAAGVHIRHVVMPAVVLGVGTAVVTFVLQLYTIPQTHFLLRSEVASDVRELMYSMLKRDAYFRFPRCNYEIYVARVQGPKLKEAQFRRRDRSGAYDMVAYAREAELLVDMMHKKIYVCMKQCYTVDRNGKADGYVDEHIWPVELPDDFATQSKFRTSDMTWSELYEYRAKFADDLVDLDRDIAQHQAALDRGRAPRHFATHVHDRTEQRKRCDLLRVAIDVEFQQRPAFALGCLGFVLVGCPVGIWFSKSDYLSAFITCFLPVVVVYYPLMLCGINMARSGQVLAAAVWTANGVILVAAAFMYDRLTRQ